MTAIGSRPRIWHSERSSKGGSYKNVSIMQWCRDKMSGEPKPSVVVTA